MRHVTIDTAQTQLSRLIEAAMAGEDIVIAKGDPPMVRWAPIVKGGFRLGILGAALGAGPDFLTPATDDEIADWKGEPTPTGADVA